jgi:alginate O-acetyltransferase complex protein AlgI
MLIGASFFFYGFGNPKLLLLLVASITLNALASYMILEGRGRKLSWAVFGVGLNLAILLVFKYSGMLVKTFFGVNPRPGGFLDLLISIPLPIGISFFTFQGISLIVDSYQGRNGASEKSGRGFLAHWIEIAHFKAFFPQLVSGPITKAHEFLPQITAKALRDVNWELAFRQLVLGYFLKTVVADNLSQLTYWISYPAFLNFSSVTLLGLLFGYSIQIFADFAGYSLIAMGVATLFGYRLPLNFNYPYISQTFSEFWTRWHISLSSWLKQYLYFPLGGNRQGAGRTYANLMIVMVLGGLWHGAAWSYAVWGAWHGLALAIERWVQHRFPKNEGNEGFSVLRASFVFGYVTFGWLLFKLTTFGEAVQYASAVVHNTHLKTDVSLLAAIALYSSPVLAYHVRYLVVTYRPTWLAPGRLEAFTLPLSYGALLFLDLLNRGPAEAFIYFQF